MPLYTDPARITADPHLICLECHKIVRTGEKLIHALACVKGDSEVINTSWLRAYQAGRSHIYEIPYPILRQLNGYDRRVKKIPLPILSE